MSVCLYVCVCVGVDVSVCAHKWMCMNAHASNTSHSNTKVS